ncbi:MAG: hypothetical protein EOO61_03720 [Hymenobacter sp.]|nr:MAG: hypothetical protein EOO61_03720 [Hymenobacter sp.]
MSVALLIEQIDGQQSDCYTPISSEAFFTTYWRPLIEKESYAWLRLMQSGLTITEEDLPEVLHELHQLKQAVPRYYPVNSGPYWHMEERLITLISELEALVGKQVQLFIG